MLPGKRRYRVSEHPLVMLINSTWAYPPLLTTGNYGYSVISIKVRLFFINKIGVYLQGHRYHLHFFLVSCIEQE